MPRMLCILFTTRFRRLAVGRKQNCQKQRCILHSLHRMRLVAIEIDPIARPQVDCRVGQPELGVPLDALEGDPAWDPVRGDLDTCRHDEAHRLEARRADDGVRSGGGETGAERAEIDQYIDALLAMWGSPDSRAGSRMSCISAPAAAAKACIWVWNSRWKAERPVPNMLVSMGRAKSSFCSV